MKKLWVLLLMLGVLVSVCAGCGGTKDTVQNDQQEEQTQTPDTPDPKKERLTDFPDLHSFAAQTADGASFGPTDLAQADLTVINMWATFCGPCIAEMPELAALEKALPENVRFITFCLDAETEQNAMESILNDAGFTGVTLVSGSGDLEKLMMQTMYVPTTVFVDDQGNMVRQELIGSPENVAETYGAAINEALTNMGKEPLS